MADNIAATTAEAVESNSWLMSIVNDIVNSPLNFILVIVIGFLIYKIISDRFEVPHAGNVTPPEPKLPKLRRDFTIQELREFDGTQPDGRVLVGVNGKVYDVTKGKHFYGPGGPYATFGGRDASRNLATFNVTRNDKEEYDDLSDLTPMEMDSVNEWELQFKEKYDYVGKLLRKGEQPTNYEDEEEENTDEPTKSNDKVETDAATKTTDKKEKDQKEENTDAANKPTEKIETDAELTAAQMDAAKAQI